MQKLDSIKDGAIQGKRVIIKADEIKAQGDVTKSKWGTIVQVGEDVPENYHEGTRVMYHENSVTAFPFDMKISSDSNLTAIENFDITDYTDIIYVLNPKK